MANLHILDKNGADVRVVAHVPVPNVNNLVGVNFRTAIVNSKLYGNPPASILVTGDGTAGTISAAELTQVQTGQLIEVIDTLRPPTTGIAAFLQAQFTAIQTRVQAQVQDALNFFGATQP